MLPLIEVAKKSFGMMIIRNYLSKKTLKNATTNYLHAYMRIDRRIIGRSTEDRREQMWTPPHLTHPAASLAADRHRGKMHPSIVLPACMHELNNLNTIGVLKQLDMTYLSQNIWEKLRNRYAVWYGMIPEKCEATKK